MQLSHNTTLPAERHIFYLWDWDKSWLLWHYSPLFLFFCGWGHLQLFTPFLATSLQICRHGRRQPLVHSLRWTVGFWTLRGKLVQRVNKYLKMTLLCNMLYGIMDASSKIHAVNDGQIWIYLFTAELWLLLYSSPSSSKPTSCKHHILLRCHSSPSAFQQVEIRSWSLHFQKDALCMIRHTFDTDTC